MTKHPDVFAALAAPFARDEVKTRPQGGRQLSYITARTAMNRLDAVLGPENWWDEYTALENSVLCRLTIRLPDGQAVTKCDAGGYAGMSDSGDDDKSGYSDAFKRAAVKFGVARYLYRDGVPAYDQEPAAAAEADPGPAREVADRPFPNQVGKPETWSQWASKLLRQVNSDWLREMVEEGVEPATRADHRELTNEPRVVNHLITLLIAKGKLSEAEVTKKGQKGEPVRDATKARAEVVRLFEATPKRVQASVQKYLFQKRAEARAKLGMVDRDEDDASDPGAPPPGKGEAYEEALSS